LNLAIALARDGHAVLLVDADMRKGSCHNRLGLTNHRGLSNVLTGGLSLEEGIQGTLVSGLSLFSRGVPPPNPAELLGSRKMKDILIELRQRFDFILIDSPPVVAISDAAILSVIADGVLLVFNGHTTSTASAQKAVERLDMVRARFLGVILNGVNLDNPDYSYYRTYSQYYQPSHENEDLNKPSAEDSAEDVTASDNTVANKNGLAEIRKNQPNNQANGESPGRNPQNYCAQPVENGSLAETAEETTFESTPTLRPTAAGKDPSRIGKPNEAVSQVFLDRLIYVFTEAVGPVGPLIVRDQISVLGESQDAFPKSRIDELVKSIEPEILHPELRLRFQERVVEEIRNIENQ
jgi:capsular exopolysaccharide synthesis family protein